MAEASEDEFLAFSLTAAEKVIISAADSCDTLIAALNDWTRHSVDAADWNAKEPYVPHLARHAVHLYDLGFIRLGKDDDRFQLVELSFSVGREILADVSRWWSFTPTGPPEVVRQWMFDSTEIEYYLMLTPKGEAVARFVEYRSWELPTHPIP